MGKVKNILKMEAEQFNIYETLKGNGHFKA